jgi:hypothetical protein
MISLQLSLIERIKIKTQKYEPSLPQKNLGPDISFPSPHLSRTS